MLRQQTAHLLRRDVSNDYTSTLTSRSTTPSRDTGKSVNAVSGSYAYYDADAVVADQRWNASISSSYDLLGNQRRR